MKWTGWLYLMVWLAILSSCNSTDQLSHNFKSEKGVEKLPITHDRFDDNRDDFRFAVVSDLYGGYRQGVFEVALKQINLLRPELILSVGDLIDGGTEDRAQLHNEWNTFDALASKARAPFFYTGGNHDLTNVVMRDVWKERYGQRYYHFIYKNTLFLILDSEDYTEGRMQEIYEARAIAIEIMDGKRSGNAATSAYFKMPERRTGRLSTTQIDYFLNILSEHPDVRWTFLLMHKPVWMGGGPGNLDRLEAAMADRPYTVMNGHFHTYDHTTRHDRDYVTMGTTGGSQNDQSDAAYDHFSFITMTDEGPSIANLKLEGVLDKEGQIPGLKKGMCFQASKCE